MRTSAKNRIIFLRFGGRYEAFEILVSLLLPAISRSMCTAFITGSGVRSACFTALSAVGSLYRSPFIFSPSMITRLYHRNTKQHSTRSDQQPDNKTNHSLSLNFAHEKGQPVKLSLLCYSLCCSINFFISSSSALAWLIPADLHASRN